MKTVRTVRLLNLEISDFKAQSMSVEFAPGLTQIRGRNRAGKSTILDAILWCLMGIDSEGRSNYRLFDENREFTPETAIPASVTLRLSIDGDAYSFRRTARQQWVRRRGSAEFAKSDADEYKYFLDGVEVPAKDFALRVSSLLAPPDKLRVILNITHYLRLKWQDLRALFASIVGEITPDMYHGDYKAIADLVERYRSEDLARQSLANAAADHRRQLVAIKASIDTLRAQSPDLSAVPQAKADIAAAEKEIADVAEQIADIQEYVRPFQEAFNAEQQAIADAERQLSQARSQFEADLDRQASDLRTAFSKAQSARSAAIAANYEADTLARSRDKRLSDAQHDYDTWKAEYDSLRQLSDAARQMSFEQSDFTACRLCGAPLQGQSLSDARAKFDEYRQSELLRIKRLGTEARQKWEAAQAEIARYSAADYVPDPIDLTPLDAEISRARQAIDAFESQRPSFDSSQQCADLRRKIDELKASRTQIPAANTADLAMRQQDLLQKIKSYSAILGLPALQENIDRKLDALHADIAAVSQALADTERLQALFVERERERAEIIGRLANQYLAGASVTMTTLSKAGEIVDCCEVRDETGVGSSTTNSASQMRIGVALSRCFSAAAGLDMPVIIDNAERMDPASLAAVLSAAPQSVTLSVADCPLTIG